MHDSLLVCFFSCVHLCICPSVRPSIGDTFFTMFLLLYHHEVFRNYYNWQSDVLAKGQGQRWKVNLTEVKKFCPNLAIFEQKLQLKFSNGYEMMHKALSSIENVPYCFSRSSVKSKGCTEQKIVDFGSECAFPECNCSLNLPMAMKWCAKLKVA